MPKTTNKNSNKNIINIKIGSSHKKQKRKSRGKSTRTPHVNYISVSNTSQPSSIIPPQALTNKPQYLDTSTQVQRERDNVLNNAVTETVRNSWLARSEGFQSHTPVSGSLKHETSPTPSPISNNSISSSRASTPYAVPIPFNLKTEETKFTSHVPTSHFQMEIPSRYSTPSVENVSVISKPQFMPTPDIVRQFDADYAFAEKELNDILKPTPKRPSTTKPDIEDHEPSVSGSGAFTQATDEITQPALKSNQDAVNRWEQLGRKAIGRVNRDAHEERLLIERIRKQKRDSYHRVKDYKRIEKTL